jgi:hypothetical protein
VRELQQAHQLSERRACGLFGITRWINRYQSRRDRKTGLRTRLRELAGSRTRYGYRRLTVLLRREGWAVNAKRVYHHTANTGRIHIHHRRDGGVPPLRLNGRARPSPSDQIRLREFTRPFSTEKAPLRTTRSRIFGRSAEILAVHGEDPPIPGTAHKAACEAITRIAVETRIRCFMGDKLRTPSVDLPRHHAGCACFISGRRAEVSQLALSTYVGRSTHSFLA